MADDVTDGVRTLIESGQADPARICIVGISYGGYAALFAGATHPELYKCVVSWAGDADLINSMRFERRETGDTDSERYTYWLKSIGDPGKQADALREGLPRHLLADLRPAGAAVARRRGRYRLTRSVTRDGAGAEEGRQVGEAGHL